MSDKPRRVLLVDDEEELVTHLEKRLSMRGFKVVGVGSGEAAVRAAQQQLFDVAVVDLKMAGMTGLETLQGLKEVQAMLQVIMLTGHGSLESAFESGRLAAFRFLIKPYEFEKLVGEIDAAHAAKRAAQRRAFQEELDALIADNPSPRDLVAESARLREKYEQ